MSIRRRLERLEEREARPPCSECGHVPGEPPKDIEVEWPDLDGKEADAGAGPEFCGSCGTQLVYVVTWADLPGPGGAGS